MDTQRRDRIVRLVLAALLLAAVAVVALTPSLRERVAELAAMFSTGDFEELQAFIASYGAYAAAVSFALMIFQSIAAPLPAFLLAFANAAMFGFWKGFLLTYVSSLSASRWTGRRAFRTQSCKRFGNVKKVERRKLPKRVDERALVEYDLIVSYGSVAPNGRSKHRETHSP